MTGTLDQLLDEWFERSFRKPRGARTSKRSITHTKVASSKHAGKRGGMPAVRGRLALTMRKAPEVMVKISGGGKGMSQIKAHFDYISRNGKVELENENGEPLLGREALRDLRDEWQFGQYGIPEDGHCKQAFNVVLSMPPGTSRDAVKNAARDFASRQFGGNHAYVFAEHADEAHPHVHLCVKAMGNDGTRLNPRKADLQLWREEFAQALRERGVAANATRRVARGIVRKGVRQQVHRMERRGEATVAMRGQRQAIDEELRGEAKHPNPHRSAIDKGRKQVVRAYGEAARLLASSSSVADRHLALEIVEFVRAMPPPLSAREVLVARRRDELLRQDKSAPESKPREIGVKPEERER